MSARLTELAWSETPKGVISLRCRREPTLGVEIHEVKLGEEFLMSSLFTVAEVELARLGLGWLGQDRTDLDVVVGGLGLGYTAVAALDDPRVGSIVVVEALGEVIDWFERGLLPNAAALCGDSRTRLLRGDFFELAATSGGFDPDTPGRTFDAILLDVDHTPRHVLHPDHAPFYTQPGMLALRRHLSPDGVFALWSDDPPDEEFGAVLASVFEEWTAEVVTFPNPLTRGESANTVYLAR